MKIWALSDELTPPIVGETRLHNGQKSMCIEPEANYGGGSGPLWATENHIAQFAVRDFWWRGYMRGHCQRVDPVRKSVHLQVITGPSWGWLAQGSVVELPASRIKRYDTLELAPIDLCSLSIEAEATAQANNVFEHVTREELNQLFVGAQTEKAREILGDRLAASCLALITLYRGLHDAMQKSGGWECHQPSKKALSYRQKLQHTLDQWSSDQA
jgi:hypothetical protein